MIPDEAIEAAKEAWFSHTLKPGSLTLEDGMREILEAAAPHLMAAAWDEGSQSGYRWALIEGPWQEPEEVAPRNPYKEAP